MKRLVLMFIVLIPCFCFCGCYDYREINDTAMVSGIAIDRGTDSLYTVSVEIVQPAESESSSAKGKVLSEDGNSVEDCLKRLVNAATKQLQFSHCKLILFSEEVVKQGISDLVDYFIRDPEYRGDLFLSVVMGAKASEMLSTGEKEDRIVSYDYANVIENSYQETGSVPPTKLYQFPISGDLSLLTVFKKSGDQFSISACAGMKDGKLFAEIDLPTVQSILLISGEFKVGELLLKTDDGIEIPCQVRSVKTKKHVVIDENPTIHVTIDCDILLTTLPNGFNISSEDHMERSEDEIAKLLTRKIQKDWNSAVSDGISEVFGLGVYLYRHQPKLYRQLTDNSSMGQLDLITECNVELANFGFADEGVVE